MSASWVFVSNYINHHQIPFCDAMYQKLEGSFAFIQTRDMEADRVQMGWSMSDLPSYVYLMQEQRQKCQDMIRRADVVIYGGVEDEQYIVERLAAKKLTFRYTERLYREALWKAISPKGLLRKYKDHTRYRKDPVYLLCAGGYVAYDFSIVKSYPNKKFCWGYFTETKSYDIDSLLEGKGYDTDHGKVVYLLWAGRFLGLKHPEKAVLAADYLKRQGIPFHLDLIGGGDVEEEICRLIKAKGLEAEVSCLGFKQPSLVRSYMEKADIFLFTSDRNEGWGAVVNESMNSGCAVVADSLIGSTTFLIHHGENGYVYHTRDQMELNRIVYRLATEKELRKRLGKAAYETITDFWNPDYASDALLKLVDKIQGAGGNIGLPYKEGMDLIPAGPAPVISERAMYQFITRKRDRK